MRVLSNLCKRITDMHGMIMVDSVDGDGSVKVPVPVFMNGLSPTFPIDEKGPDDPRDPIRRSAIILRVSDGTWREDFCAGDAPLEITISATFYLPGSGCEIELSAPTADDPDAKKLIPAPDALDLLLPLLTALDREGINYLPPQFADIDIVDAIATGIDAVVYIPMVYSELANAPTG